MKGVAWIIRQSLLKHEIRTNKNISRNWSAIIADYEKNYLYIGMSTWSTLV